MPEEEALQSTEAKDSVSNSAIAFDRMSKGWELIVDLLGGTRKMRAAQTKWLPKEPKEDVDDYHVRLARTFLFNGYKRTVGQMSAMPFIKPVVMSEDSDELFQEMESDVDLAGRHLTGFAKDLVDDLLNYGKAHILPDMPQFEGPVSREEQERRKIRPYFSRISPTSLFSWTTRRDAGETIIEEIRIRETVVKKKGEWSEEEVSQIRVIRPDQWFVFEKKKDEENYALADDGVNALGKVPLVTIYAKRLGEMVSESPFEDLAQLNLRHWQSQSDQDHILHVARVPILVATGFQEEELAGGTISVNTLIISTNPEANLKYVEHSGDAIEAGRKDLESIENRMRIMGAEMLVKKPVNTATEKIIDSAEQVSDLQMLVRGVERGLEQAFRFAAEWAELDPEKVEIRIDINQDFGISLKDKEDLDALEAARNRNDIDQETFLNEIARRGILADNIDIEEIMKKTETERNAMSVSIDLPPDDEDEEEGAAA